MMKKPELRIAPEAPYEYDLQERVVRRLQDSPLHVHGVSVMSSVPAELGGDPDDPRQAMMVTLTLVTDGRRGWLVLVDEAPEVDMAAEMAELVGEIASEGATFVARAATRWDAPVRAHTLDLRDGPRVCAAVEAAYEEAFAEAEGAELEGFVRAFEAVRFPVRDERALRAFIAEMEGEIGAPVPA